MLSSRSVAVIVKRPSRASTRRLERIGIVVLRSTTPCVVLSSFRRADFVTLNSIAWLSSRAVPVADIRFPFASKAYGKRPETPDGIPLQRTLLGFSAGRKAYERRCYVEISGKRPIGRRAAQRSNTRQTTSKNSTGNHCKNCIRKKLQPCCCDEPCGTVESCAYAQMKAT